MLALLLVVGCAVVRLVEGIHPEILAGATPCVAFAFVAGVYLPPRWSWMLGAAVILLSELAFLRWDFLSTGQWFSWMILISLAFYALMGGLGVLLPRRPSLALLFGGPVMGSILFYLGANTLSWWASAGSAVYGYPQTLAGWVQANTTGLPGYVPTWTFLRNGLVADVFFTAVLIAIFDSSRFALPGRAKLAARS